MLKSIFITCASGIVFGLSLFAAERVFFRNKKPFIVTLLSTVRLAGLGVFFYFMLKSNDIHPIILTTLFLSAYWLTILKFKEFLYGKQ